MKLTQAIALSALITGIAILCTQAANAEVRYDRALKNDMAKDMAQDDAGNWLYVVGTTQTAGGNNDITISKYSTLGVPAGAPWPQHWNGAGAASDDQGIAIDVDSLGNVYAVGTSNSAGTGKDIVVLKYSSGGVKMGTYRFNGTANADDVPIDIGCADYAGLGVEDVYIAGNTMSKATAEDIVVIGISSATMLELWPPAIWDRGLGKNDHAYALVGPRQYTDGWSVIRAPSLSTKLLAICGKTMNKTNYDMLVKNFDPVTGSAFTAAPFDLWIYNGTANGDDWLLDADADNEGVDFTGSVLTNENAYEIGTVTFTGGAFPNYREEHRFAGNYNDYGKDIECDNLQKVDVGADVPQVAVVGDARTDLAVYNYVTGLGAPIWAYYRNISNYDQVIKMSLANAGVDCIGASYRNAGGNTSSAILAVTSAGVLSWGPTLYDPFGYYDAPAMVRASRNYASVYMVGSSASAPAATGSDWFSMKYVVASGAVAASVW